MLRFFRFQNLTIFFYLAICWLVLFFIEQKDFNLVIAITMFVLHFCKVKYLEQEESK